MKIPPILERLILSGKAQFSTWSFGTAGAGTLRLSKNEFMILLDFDYFHFVDEVPNTTGEPATATSIVTPVDPTSTFTLTYDFNGTVLAGVFFDPSNPGTVATTAADFQLALTAALPGFTSNVKWSGTFWSITVLTTAPGIAYNGIIPVISTTLIVAPVIVPGIFAGGTASTVATFQDMIDRATHQLEFRQKGKRYSWIIASDLFMIPFDPAGGTAYANVQGCYQKDLFIPFTESVQIGIVTVPPVDDWTINYQPLDAKSNEPKLPGGYGTASSGANLDVVYDIVFDPIVLDKYIPVTEERSDSATVGYREQFMVNYADGRELNNPQGAFSNQGAARRYPIINMSYVVVHMTWADFQQYLSNGQDCKNV